MKNSYFIFIFSLLLPWCTLPLEETQTVVPLIKRLKKIKIRSIKKHIIARFDKYKRCIWSGPCTQKEMNEFQQDAKKAIYAIMIATAGTYILRYMYKSVEKKGEKPTIIFPVQWVERKKRKIKKIFKGGKKVLRVAEGLADGETQIAIQTPLGEVTVRPSPVPKKQEEQPSQQEPPQQEEEWCWRDSIMNPWNWVPTSIFEGEW